MAERTIKVAFSTVVRRTLLYAGISFVFATLFWQLVPLPLPVQIASVTLSCLLFVLLVQLRFSTQMTVALWTRVWGSLAPIFASSLLILPSFPFLPLLALLVVITFILGIWAAYRFYPLERDSRLHRARFSRLDEMETLLAKEPVADGLVLGMVKQFFFTRHYVCVRPTREKPEIGNTLILGPSGGGKGNQIRGQILAWEGHLIINDIKGDLFLATAGYKAKHGPVYVIDPTRGVGHCFDPLYGKTTEDSYLTVARNLVFDPKDHDPFFAESASLMIVQLFKASRLEGIAPLIYLRHMIDLGLPGVAKRLNQLDPRLATAFLGADFAQAHLDNKTLVSIWTTLQTRLTPLLTETLVRCFAKSDFTAETIIRGKEPVTLYLRWEEGELERLAPLVRVFCASLLKELIATWDRVQGAGCRPVLLALDEIGRTPIPDLDGLASTVRSRDLRLQLYAQDFAQLIKNYGEQEAKIISSNMDNHLFLRPNQQETAESIERILGKGSQYSQSKHFREGSEYSEGLAEQAIPVMAARDIIELPDKYALFFRLNFRPMKILRLKWWESSHLRHRHNLPVPKLQTLPSIPPLPELVVRESATSALQFVDPDQICKKRAAQPRKNTEETNQPAKRETTIFAFSRRERAPNRRTDLQR